MEAKKQLTDEMADVLLKICSLLMTAGANTNRLLLILNKFAELMNTDAQVFINHKAFIISLTDKNTGEKTTQVKRLPHHKINFSIISALSRAGLQAEKDSWNFVEIKNEVDRIENLKHYPRIIILTAVSFAGAGFCNLFGGDYINMFFTFIATFIGLFVRQEAVKRAYNPYLCAFAGAFFAALTASLSVYIIPDTQPHLAIATSVLFLIPGVPLINSFTDMLDGYIITGFVRFINGLLFVMAIALALFIVMYVFGIQKL